MSDIIYSSKLSCVFNVKLLQQEVMSVLKSNWVHHVNTNCYHGDWDVLPIRTLKQNLEQHPILQCFALEEKGEWANLPLIEQLSEVSKVIEFFQCDVEAVRFMRLKPNAEIKSHQDKGLAMEYGSARFHLPIFAAEQVDFIVNEKRIPMQNGELWYLNADAIHSVIHIGNEDRINLVIDCHVNPWLKQQIMQEDIRYMNSANIIRENK
jgi:hypothetical protein